MSDRIGEQILVESYKILYDYIAMNESEDTKFELQIKTFKKIEMALYEESKAKSDIFRKMIGNREKLEEPIVILHNMGELFKFYDDNENDALELMKMISSNDVDGIKDGGYTRSKGAFLIDNVGDIAALETTFKLKVIEKGYLSDDVYKKFILKAFPVWVKSARRLLSAANKYSK